MIDHSRFEITVWRNDDACFFLLLCPETNRKVRASLPFSQELVKRYKRWQRRYYRFYHFPFSSELPDSGSIGSSSGDLVNDLKEAEQELIKAFQKWLGQGELREIQQEIQTEINRNISHLSKSAKLSKKHPPVDLFIACDSLDLARLPWESWEVIPQDSHFSTVRIMRTSMNSPEAINIKPKLQFYRKTRILAILGRDPRLPLQEDWKALQQLKSIAEVELINWSSAEKAVNIKKKITATIADERGWDVLFFAGHSDETNTTGGKLAIAPNVFLSISEIESQLIQARDNGLQLAIFNSCSGLSIANSLINLGLQVIVMREPIRNDVAQSFLKYFCQHLVQHCDILNALKSACKYLQSNEKFAYPSAYLIPSFFCPTGIVPFQIKSLNWKQRLLQWQPTKIETAAVSVILVLSFQISVQDFLLEQRIWVQSIYRTITGQVPQGTPPVMLIHIDQESISRANIDGNKIDPIDRKYLARIIQKASTLETKVIGLDYFLNSPTTEDQLLAQSIRTAIERKGIWFVFGTKKDLRKAEVKITDKIVNINQSLRGYTNAPLWYIKLLTANEDCIQSCPFSYLLAIAHVLNQNPPSPDLPNPKLRNKTDFRLQVIAYLKKINTQHQQINFLKKARVPAITDFANEQFSQLWLQPIIDFSIQPGQVYERIPAWKFLESSFDKKDKLRSKQQILMIAPGGYDRAGVIPGSDTFPLPRAFAYWQERSYKMANSQETYLQKFTGGEGLAYMVHHLLRQRFVIPIPDLWVMVVAIFLGKGTTLILYQHQRQQRRWLIGLGSATAVYGLVGLQIYISGAVLVPWVLPSTVFWIFVLSTIRR